MARKKTVVKREKLKPLKKKRQLTEEAKDKLRARLATMRAKTKPADYKNKASLFWLFPMMTSILSRILKRGLNTQKI